MVSNCSESHLPGSEPRTKSGGSGDSIAHGSVAKHIITSTSAKERIMPEKIYPCACVTSVRSRRAQLPLTLVRRCSIGRRWARKRPHQQHSKHMIHRHTLAGARGKRCLKSRPEPRLVGGQSCAVKRCGSRVRTRKCVDSDRRCPKEDTWLEGE